MEIRRRAERRLGEMLADRVPHPRGVAPALGSKEEPNTERPPKLSEVLELPMPAPKN